ncbi:hypothetical protein D9757_015412 [Collybiopsis confluens]|uniref:Retrotransposon gag domain-containing protein n=1 Tax=Collybiopsis confluens TaxID=2823264 RepID=A0A8H5G898_9AGAR|nr:hypothetical protein D9757_015412 [Collybiopsis confluens]
MEAVTYACAMFGARPLHQLALVIGYNYKSHEMQFLIFHRGGLTALTPLDLNSEEGQKDLIILLFALLTWKSHADAGFPSWCNKAQVHLPNFYSTPVNVREKSQIKTPIPDLHGKQSQPSNWGPSTVSLRDSRFGFGQGIEGCKANSLLESLNGIRLNENHSETMSNDSSSILLDVPNDLNASALLDAPAADGTTKKENTRRALLRPTRLGSLSSTNYKEEPTHIIETTQLNNDGSPITTRIRTSGIARNVFGEGYVGMVRVSGQLRPRGAAPFSSRAPTGTRYTIPPIIPLPTSPQTPIQQSTPQRTTSVTFDDNGWYDQTEPTDEIVLTQTNKRKGREYQDKTNKSDPGDPGDPDDGPPDDDDPPGGGNPPIPPRGPSRGGPPIGGPPGGGSALGPLGPLPFLSNNDTSQLFLQALIRLNNTLSSMKGGETKSKVRAPDYFDTDEKKILFVLSYLSGRALSWFEPEILNPNLLNPPAWLFSFEKFITELQENFGPFDPIGDAEESLNELQMDNSERVIGYNTKFNAYAALVDWNDSALRFVYRKGLAPRIKDDLKNITEHRNLWIFKTQIAELDNKYWKRVHERKVKARMHPASAPPKLGKNSLNSNQVHTTTTVSSTLSTSGSGSKPNPSPKSPPTNSPKPWLDKLGKDGCLSKAKKKCRKDKGLCSYCGGNHKLEDCDRRNKNLERKGRGGTISEASPSGAGKLARSSDSSARDWSCVNQDCAFLEVTLNAAALSLNSLIKSLFTSHPISHSSLELPTLIDSGSSDNFMDSKFVHTHSLSTIKIPPVKLQLLDGSYGSVISKKISLPISFNIGKPLSIDFYITSLDSSCKAVLGYSFLSRYNPSIDWVKGNITFPNTDQAESSIRVPLVTKPEPTGPPDPELSDMPMSPLPIRKPTKPSKEKFPFEPIYTYPSVSQIPRVRTSNEKK